MRKLVALLACVAAVGTIAATASASHSWNNYHWARTGNPFTIQLGDNVTSDWDSYLATTAADWSKATVLDTVVAPGQARGRCKATAGRVEVCNDRYGSNGWLGLAQIWLSGGHITQGTVKVNDTYFGLPQYNTPAERNHVMCQEVGHTLGLTHTSEDGSSQQTCMDYSTDQRSQHPNQHDYDQLALIYSHLDSTTTIGASTSFLPDAVPSWAPASQRTGSLYVDDLGEGRQLLTFVIWANPIHSQF